MSQLPNLITDLALILVVAGAVTLLFKKLKQPLVLGYIVAGFLVSPHMPYVKSVVDAVDIKIWADIGVIFLLFSMGLDFSFKKIAKLGMAPFIAVSSIVFFMSIVGYAAAHIFGWSHMECIFLAAVFAVCSSTTIIYKTLTDLKLKQQRFANIVLSVLVLEDVLSIVLLVMLSAVATGKGMEGRELIEIVMKIVFFIVLWFVVGIFVIPMALRKLRRLLTNEILLIVSLGLCFFMAVFSTKVGFSSAFGAFVMGSILAETIEGKTIMRVVDPVKDLFGAVFFVSVGMLVDPKVLVAYAVPILIVVVLIIVGQAIFGTLSFVLSGQSLKTAMQCSFTIAQIGEFPFIIISLGVSLGAIGGFMYPVVVAGSALTTFLTPYVLKSALPTYNFIEAHLPRHWVKRLNRLTIGEQTTAADNKWRALLMPMLRQTLIYSILSTATIGLMLTFFLPFVQRLLPPFWAHTVCGILTIMAISPFLRALVMKKNHSEEFKYLWSKSHSNRFPLLFTVLVRILIAIGFIFYICHYLSNLSVALIASIAVATIVPILMSRRLKRRSIMLERLFVQNLRSKEIEDAVLGRKKPLYANRLLDRDIHIADFDVPEDSLWGGKTLEQLHLRKTFGVHVSSILRGKRRINIPNGRTIIFPGDKIQAIGSDEQLTRLDAAINNERYADDPEIEKREMRLHQLIIDKNSPFVGKTLQESNIRNRYNCMVVGMEEGEENLTPIHPQYLFKQGDVIWLVGENRSLELLQHI